MPGRGIGKPSLSTGRPSWICRRRSYLRDDVKLQSLFSSFEALVAPFLA